MKTKIVKNSSLYKWGRNFKRIQDRFYKNQYKLKRIQQIETFIKQGKFQKVYHIKQTRLDLDIPTVDNIIDCDLVLVTHQGYSRFSCKGIIRWIKGLINNNKNLYFCLNRHYLNIDNSDIGLELDDDYEKAIVQWLKLSLPDYTVKELSNRYVDKGKHFTWSVPDKHFYICKN